MAQISYNLLGDSNPGDNSDNNPGKNIADNSANTLVTTQVQQSQNSLEIPPPAHQPPVNNTLATTTAANVKSPETQTASSSQSVNLLAIEPSKQAPQPQVQQSTNLLTTTNTTERTTSSQIASDHDSILNTIVEQNTQAPVAEKQILDELELSTAGLDDFDIPLPEKKQVMNVKTARNIFLTTLVLAIASVSYFTGKIPSTFSTANLDIIGKSQQQLNEIQTGLIVKKYLSSAIALDTLAIDTAKFHQANIAHNSAVSQKYKATIQKNLQEISTNIQSANKIMQEHIELVENLPQAFNDEIAKQEKLALEAENLADRESYKTLHNMYIGAKQIYENRGDFNHLANLNLEEISGPELIVAIKGVFTNVNYSPLIKSTLVELNRKNWTVIFNELDTIVKKFDPGFDVFQAKNDYTLVFSGYSLDAENRRITISGNVKTKDSKTFTLITNLVDKLEESLLFENLEYTSFVKSFNEEEGTYSSSLALSFDIENNLIYD